MIYASLQEQLQSLQQLLQVINSSDYMYKSNMLQSNSIGQHVRHVVEMLQCLLNGYEAGIVNYDERKRDTRIETDKNFTAALLQEVSVNLQQPDKGLTLQQDGNYEAVHTTFKRELLYNTEHAIHHMALIKVALREMKIDIKNENFGVAPATIRYKNAIACVQ